MQAALVAYAATAFLGFALLGRFVTSRTPTRIDVEAVALRGIGTEPAAFFTRLGYWPALTILGAAAVLLLFERATPAWLPEALVLSHVLSQAAIVAIKPVFHRTRPDYWIVRHEVDTSFPSGHSSTAITFYVALLPVAAGARFAHSIRDVVAFALVACALGIPWSRLALGAHYLTDVLGGLLFGSAWLAASTALALAFVR